MKKITTLLLAILFVNNCIAQTSFTKSTIPDTLVVLSSKDEMTDKTSYFPSQKIICAKTDKSVGFSLSVFIDDDLTIKDLKVVMIGLGGCVEDNEIIILFDDDTKLNLKSWNKFNCDGDAWFTISKKDIELLSTKKIKKIRVTNGRTFENYTGEVKEERKDYFVRLFKALNNKQTFEFKKS